MPRISWGDTVLVGVTVGGTGVGMGVAACVDVGLGMLVRVDVGFGVLVCAGVADGAVVNVLDGTGVGDVVDVPRAAVGTSCVEWQEATQIAMKTSATTILLRTIYLHHSGQRHDVRIGAKSRSNPSANGPTSGPSSQ